VLNQQPLMQNVLADLVLESEGALALSMRVARAMDNRAERHEDLLVRLCTAIGKYWICKRTPNHAYEAMECIGGSGVMEDSPFPRLFRESPVNAIWEGSGNVQCLDVLRAMKKTPEVVDAFFLEVAKARAPARRSITGSARCGRRSTIPPTSNTAPATSSTGWRWRSRQRCCCNMRRRTSQLRSARPA
jgi:putative acyl-CoA dehydrogenase